MKPRSARRSANWLTSWMSASPAHPSPYPTRGGFLVKPSTSTAVCTSWRSGRLATGETIMTRLLLGNIEADTSDDEIREFLEKYGFSAFDEIEHTLGTG